MKSEGVKRGHGVDCDVCVCMRNECNMVSEQERGEESLSGDLAIVLLSSRNTLSISLIRGCESLMIRQLARVV